jgi:hypothetical protein
LIAVRYFTQEETAPKATVSDASNATPDRMSEVTPPRNGTDAPRRIMEHPDSHGNNANTGTSDFGTAQQAQADGYLVSNPMPSTTEPTMKNTNAAAKGEYSYEINQQQILEQAKIEGIDLPDTDVNAPTEDNISSAACGEYSEQIETSDQLRNDTK